MLKKLIRTFCTRETITYLIFGVLTTAVNWLVYNLLKAALGDNWILLINALAFVAAVIFAYVTNKLFVFQEKSWAPAVLWREIPTFFAARLFSFGLEEAALALAEYALDLGRFTFLGIDGVDWTKYAMAVVTVILNYFFSKFLVFRKKDKENPGL